MQRRHFLQFTAASSALAGAGELSAHDDHSHEAQHTELQSEIEDLLTATEAAWDSQDSSQLKGLWDQDDEHPYYLAGEQEDFFVGWDALNKYLDPRAMKVTQAIRVRFYDISTRLLAPDLAYAAYWMRTDMKLVFSPKPFGSDNRASAVFRRKPEGWRYICYTEAFQAPSLYFQKLFEKDVSPEYEKFYEETMGKKLPG
jgi:hypothetical protein